MSALIAPHGGRLVDGLVAVTERTALKSAATQLPSWDLTARQLCDVELLLNGSFSPLQGFMTRADHEGVCRDMRLASGVLWPMPVALDVSQAFVDSIQGAQRIALRDPEGVVVAVMDVEDVWLGDHDAEARQVFGSTDTRHAGVAYLVERAHPVYVGGRLHGLELPRHYDFRHLRMTPMETRAHFEKLGWRRVVAFQTRNPMHRAHLELTFRAAQIAEANLLIHPSVGMTKPGDIDHYTRVRCYEKLLAHYPEQTTALALLNLAMRMGGPREALWHAIIRKNHGASHFIVGRDHAGPGQDASGEPFYGAYDAQHLVREHHEELGITMVPFQEMVYVQNRAQYAPADEVAEDETVLNISGTELRRRLHEGLETPDWFTYPEVIEELRRTHPPRERQGFCVFFTGLSGAGKSTLANALLVRLLESGSRPVTLLDGDVVRKHLSSELGFSKEHRDLNVQRIGFVASEITKNGGIALCAPIAPYAKSRHSVREMIAQYGLFIEVHVATPLDVCESRDRKGLYALARAGKIKEFTGISDPYEIPEHPEMRIDTSDVAPEDAVQQILLKLEALGLIRPTR